MSKCNCRFVLDKEKKRFYLKCDGEPGNHGPIEIDLAAETWAFTWLKKNNRLRPYDKRVGFFDNVVLNYIRWVSGEFGYEPSRETILAAYAGMPGAMLDKALYALAKNGLIEKTEKGYAPKTGE